MTSRDQLAALAWEARQRGISYGQLTAQLKPGEDLEIYARFRKARAEKMREREKKDPEWQRAMKECRKKKR